jgi:hypothetical protein
LIASKVCFVSVLWRRNVSTVTCTLNGRILARFMLDSWLSQVLGGQWSSKSTGATSTSHPQRMRGRLLLLRM